MKLHDVGFSSNCKKVRIAARELGIALEIEPIDLQAQAHRAPQYLKKNPMGKFPTFEDGDFSLWESAAILVYLAGQAPEAGLWPSDVQGQADGLRWLFWYTAHVQSHTTTLAVERFVKPKILGLPGHDAHLIAEADSNLARFLPVLERHLTGRAYILDAYSVADIAIGCGIEAGARVGMDLTPYPQISQWLTTLQARPAWQEAG